MVGSLPDRVDRFGSVAHHVAVAAGSGDDLVEHLAIGVRVLDDQYATMDPGRVTTTVPNAADVRLIRSRPVERNLEPEERTVACGTLEADPPIAAACKYTR